MAQTIGIFGAGYVGLVTGACFADLGHTVVLRDVVPERIEGLEAGRIPIYEPGLDELVERNRERLRFTLDVREVVDAADVLYVAVGTPPTYSGDADLSAVWTVVDELPRVDRRIVLVMKSTVPVGTGEKVRAALDARGLDNVGYVSNPEFLAEGTAIRDFRNPDRIVVGAFEVADCDLVERLHEGIDAPVVRTDVASAEMVKLASNAFLSTRISFINEIANVCELVGADVEQVARGMGLDHRLGPHFLRAGIGFGGSCLDGRETVLARVAGRTWLTTLERLYSDLEASGSVPLEVLAWRKEAETPEFLPVAGLTRRPYDGALLEVRTKMGRRVRVTPDHPLVVATADGAGVRVKLACELTNDDWLPVVQGAPAHAARPDAPDILDGMVAAGISAADVIVRPKRTRLADAGPDRVRSALRSLGHPRAAARTHDILRAGALRLDEAVEAELDLDSASYGTVKNGTFVPRVLSLDERFWHVVGLYIAEGHATARGTWHRLTWSFHPRDEFDLVEELLRFWRLNGVKALWTPTPTSANVVVKSRLLVGWWLGSLGLGANCYEQRIPDVAWSAPESHKRALVAGMWRGDGSWSYIAGGPSVALEYGTVSRELADGLLRLLSDLGVVARLKVGRTAKSTCDTYWLVVSGADQVEGLLDLVAEPDRAPILDSLGHQKKRIAPTGYRRHDSNAAWVRVARVDRVPAAGAVYSLEVVGGETLATTGGLVVHNCFPKDVSALKQLAGNSGYHFQLLSAVIEVNELQKRRVVQKLKKHLGTLRGKTVALLGLAFKPGTDDLREAPALVLASRLLAEGADVRGWDPVADASELLQGATLSPTVLDAVRGADAAVVVTEWPELRELAREEVREAMARPLIIDGRNILDPAQVRAAGFAYEGIGRAGSPFDALPETPEREPQPEVSP